jgi:hypothetical protein
VANLVCPKCNATAFQFLYGCKFDGPCYYPSLGKFDAEAYAHRFDALKNSPEFVKRMSEDWDKVFGPCPG